MSDDEEESKVVPPPTAAKGKNKRHQSNFLLLIIHLGLTEEKPAKKGKSKSPAPKTEEKPKSRKVGKLVEEPKGLQPTRPLTSYIFFSNQELPKVVTAQGVSHKEAMKVVGAMWGNLTEEQKAPYAKKHEEDKRRYV